MTADRRSRLRTRLVLAGLVFALVMPRVLLVWNGFTKPQRSLLTDSAGYLELADSIRLEGRFHASEHEESLRTPGYPALIALVQAIFGEHVGFVILVQVLLTLLTAWLVFRSARALGGEHVGMAAVWLYALSPNVIFWAATIMTETFFAFWLALAMALVIEGLVRGSRRWSAVGGLSLGMAVLTRPIGLYLVPLWAVGVLLAGWRMLKGHRRWANAASVLLAALLPVLAWQARNLLVHDSFRLTASFQTVFIDYTAASALGDALGITRDEAAAQLRLSPDAFGAALDAVRQYPGSLARVAMQGIARTALGTEAGTWLRVLSGASYQSSGLLESLLRGDWRGAAEGLRLRMQANGDRLGTGLLAWGMLYSVAVYLLSLLGLSRLRRIHPAGLRWMYAIVLLSALYLIVMPLTIGDARFRVPVEPFLALLGGMALVKRPLLGLTAVAERKAAG
jgi:4-amino-4-deoxy-L-arabinose transferase-like glycosyltransferase